MNEGKIRPHKISKKGNKFKVTCKPKLFTHKPRIPANNKGGNQERA